MFCEGMTLLQSSHRGLHPFATVAAVKGDIYRFPGSFYSLQIPEIFRSIDHKKRAHMIQYHKALRMLIMIWDMLNYHSSYSLSQGDQKRLKYRRNSLSPRSLPWLLISPVQAVISYHLHLPSPNRDLHGCCLNDIHSNGCKFIHMLYSNNASRKSLALDEDSDEIQLIL